MGYALKNPFGVQSLMHLIDPEVLINNTHNTIVYEQDGNLRNHVMKMFSTANCIDSLEQDFKHLPGCLPDIVAPQFTYNNLFRVIINVATFLILAQVYGNLIAGILFMERRNPAGSRSWRVPILYY